MLTRRRLAAGALAAAAVLATMQGFPASAAARVSVFAAASLKNALDEVSAAWKADAGKETTNVYAASSALARQIEAGAPADVFISADLDWMKYLSDRKLIAAGSEVKLLGNTLVLVVPAGSMASAITIVPGFNLAGVLQGGRLAVGDVTSVPAGKYARAALQSLGLWPGVEASLAQAENVRAALKLVASGEAAAGIVYGSDAREDSKVKLLGTFPADSHPAIVYPAARTATSTNADAAAFLAFLRSPRARDIFTAHGFTTAAGN